MGLRRNTPEYNDRVELQRLLKSQIADFESRLAALESGGGGGGLSDVVDDTSPELGGNLDGGGFAITNIGNVDGRDVSADGTALDALQATIGRGSSFPGSPSNGDMYLRTDFDMPELFYYDSTRGKWLGELRLWQFARATAASSGTLNLQIGPVQCTASRGVLTPAELTVVGIEAFNANSGVTCDFNLYEGSTNLTTLLSFSGDRAKHDHTLNYDLDADAGWPHKYLQVNNITAGTLNNPIVNVYFRRRAT